MGLFGFGKSKKAEEIDLILKSLQLAFENNYKDNAKANLKKFEEVYNRAVAEKTLKPKEIEAYGKQLEELNERLKHFDHKQPIKH